MMPVLDHLADVSGDDERRLELLFEAFELAWQAGPRPRIADHLPAEAPLRRAALIELIYIDQEYAIRSDFPASVEDYLAQFPELINELDLVADLIAREFRLRKRKGDGPSTEDYLGRFPHLGTRLEARLNAEAAVSSRLPGETTIEALSTDPVAEETPRALPSEANPSYDQLRFHARGGLGDVYRARDVELSREVALKRIRLKFSSESRVRRRFLREARLTARLNHPGVVPIHGLIWDRHDQPWYVMRFVEGQTLEQAIKDYHDPAKTDADRPLAFRKLLARYIAVCDTIAFAHSRDVVHRDLKPSNVILGDYGETIVLDWGLATSTQTTPADPSPTQPIPDTEETDPLTHAGQVLGTPAFMSPEQAKGLPTMNQPASDIYGLGSILYTILAGRSPFAPESWTILKEKIILGQYPAPRQFQPEIPRPLEAIGRKAMALEPAHRYETAGALARDVERWLADEPVTAYPEPWTRKTRRWAKKHRTAVTTVASTALVAALLIGAYAWSVLDHTRRADAAAMGTFARVEILEAEARKNDEPTRWSEAIAEARRAEAQIESGGSDAAKFRIRAKLADLQQAFHVVVMDRRMIDYLEEARVRGTYVKNGRYDDEAKIKAYISAFQAYGIDLGTLPVEESAKRIRSSKIAEELIAALDDWPYQEATIIPYNRKQRIAQTAKMVDHEQAAIRNAVANLDAAGLRQLCEREEDRRKLGPQLRAIFQALIERDPEGSFPLLEAIRRDNPTDFWLNQNLGMAYFRVGRPKLTECLRCLSVAIALRPDSPGVHLNLGNALDAKGDRDGAIAEYRIATRLDPQYSTAHFNLGIVLFAKGDLVDAIAEYRIAARLDPEYADTHYDLGIALKAIGDIDGAIAEYRIAIRLNGAYGEAHTNLGGALFERGDLEEAKAEYQYAIRINPKLFQAHIGLGMYLQAKGNIDGAIAEFRNATLLEREHDDAHVKLGKALKVKGNIDGAIAEYRIAILSNPENADAHENLGYALRAKRDYDGAIAEFRNAIRIRPGNAVVHVGLGFVLSLKGDLNGAIVEYRIAISINPEHAEAHSWLGKFLEMQGYFAEGLTHLERAYDLGSKIANWRYMTQTAQWVAECRRLVELDSKLPAMLKGDASPKDAEESMTVADLCVRKSLYAASVRFFDKALAERPEFTNKDKAGYMFRYNAARAAAMGGTGQDKGNPLPDEAVRAQLRKKSLDWLRAELAKWVDLLEIGSHPNRKLTILQTLDLWKNENDLAGIRDEAALAKLPEGEREAFRAFWAEVEALRKKAAGS